MQSTFNLHAAINLQTAFNLQPAPAICNQPVSCMQPEYNNKTLPEILVCNLQSSYNRHATCNLQSTFNLQHACNLQAPCLYATCNQQLWGTHSADAKSFLDMIFPVIAYCVNEM